MFPCGGKFVSDEAQPEEPAPEGVFRIIGDRARRAGRFGAQRLCADGEAQLDVGFDLARVECAVEGAEFDGVLAEADVDVDAAGAVGLCARRPDGSDDLLHHLDVLVAAHRADHLRRGGGDRAVTLDRPVPPVGHGHLPVVKVAANVPRRRAFPASAPQTARAVRPRARAALAALQCGPKGGSNPWAVPAGDRGPLSCEFSQNSGVGVSPQKSKSAALFRTAVCIENGEGQAHACHLDYIIPHRGDMRLFWDESNWQAL